MSKAFLEPYYDPNDSGRTPAQQASDSLLNNGVVSQHESALLKGQIKTGGGRTLNIPPPVPGRSDLMPGPTFNNGWYVGAPCQGAHCGVQMLPTASWMTNVGIGVGGNEVVPNSNTMYHVVNRMGNSFAENLPGVAAYTGTSLNSGPFEIKCVSGGNKSSRRNKQKRNKKSRKSRNQKRY